MPGMKVSGKFRVGKRKLITYFIYPLIRTLGNSFCRTMMKLKLVLELIVTLLSLVIAAIILGGSLEFLDPEIVEIMRLKYFDHSSKKNPRETKRSNIFSN